MKNIIYSIREWFNTKLKPREKPPVLQNILALWSIVLILSGFIYWRFFFHYFNIRPSLYPTWEDAILVNYDKLILVAMNVIVFSLLVIWFLFVKSNIDFNTKGKILMRNLALGFLVTLIFLFALSRQSIDSPSRILGISLIFGAACLPIQLKSRFLVMSIFLILVPMLFAYMGNRDARFAVTQKVTFDLKLDTNETIMEEGNKNRFFVGSTSNYVFVYSANTCKIRPIHRDDITLITFSAKL